MKLSELIDKRADKRIESRQIPNREPATVLSFTEGWLRADVRLANGTIIKGMLNKTGEKLTAGQSVYVEYMTMPSSGWIAMTTGEADPLGGSGGIATTVENAAVMSTDFEDFVVDEELMLDISPETRLYYGNMPAFIIVQGHYCLLCSSSSTVAYTNGQWVIGGIDGLYERIIANKAKFGSQIGDTARGGFLYGKSTNLAYPDSYIYQSIDIYSVSANTNGYSYSGRLNQRYATVSAPLNNWWEESLTWGSFSLTTYNISLRNPNNTVYFSELSDIFIVPVVTAYFNVQNVSALQTPYGYVSISGYLIFASDGGEDYGVVYQSVVSGNTVMSHVPLISEAERCFTLGITQRTEPVYPTDGGG